MTESYDVATFPGAELNSNYMVPYFKNIYSEILMKYMYLSHTPSDEIPPNFFVWEFENVAKMAPNQKLQ